VDRVRSAPVAQVMLLERLVAILLSMLPEMALRVVLMAVAAPRLLTQALPLLQALRLMPQLVLLPTLLQLPTPRLLLSTVLTALRLTRALPLPRAPKLTLHPAQLHLRLQLLPMQLPHPCTVPTLLLPASLPSMLPLALPLAQLPLPWPLVPMEALTSHTSSALTVLSVAQPPAMLPAVELPQAV
jgi:hypothetical protein